MASLYALWSELATAADQQRIYINGVPPPQLQQQVVLQLLLSTSHLQTLATPPPDSFNSLLQQFSSSSPASCTGGGSAISVCDLLDVYGMSQAATMRSLNRMNRCFIALDVVRLVQQQLHGQQQPGEASSTGSSCIQPFTSEEALRGFAADWLHSGGVSAVLDITANLRDCASWSCSSNCWRRPCRR